VLLKSLASQNRLLFTPTNKIHTRLVVCTRFVAFAMFVVCARFAVCTRFQAKLFGVNTIIFMEMCEDLDNKYCVGA
jgi:hypothetical protein